MNSKVKVFVIVTFVAMVVVNALANILPINGLETGQISDFYANLFVPAPITFVIWSLIYLLLLGYTLYQAQIIYKKDTRNKNVLNKIGILFSISSVANTMWIFAWHYQRVFLSVIWMVIILVCLIMIAGVMKEEPLSKKEMLFIKLPFSVYFGWITVATIANIITWLVCINWNGFGISKASWTVIILIIGAIIAIATMLKNRNCVYGLAVIWAYAGILIKHVSASGFDNMYPQIITATIICLILLSMVDIPILVKNFKRMQKK